MPSHIRWYHTTIYLRSALSTFCLLSSRVLRSKEIHTQSWGALLLCKCSRGQSPQFWCYFAHLTTSSQASDRDDRFLPYGYTPRLRLSAERTCMHLGLTASSSSLCNQRAPLHLHTPWSRIAVLRFQLSKERSYIIMKIWKAIKLVLTNCSQRI